jgi:hypothetical protein
MVDLTEAFNRAKQAEEEGRDFYTPLTKPKIVDDRMVFESDAPNPTIDEAPY